jgi:hypothetical protein
MNNNQYIPTKLVPTSNEHRQPPWRHPAYLALWERMPYGVQIRLIELEARLDNKFKTRVSVKRRAGLNRVQRTVLLTMIGAAVRGLTYLLHTKQ